MITLALALPVGRENLIVNFAGIVYNPVSFRDGFHAEKSICSRRYIKKIAGHSLTTFSKETIMTKPQWAQPGGLCLSEFGTPDVGLASAGWVARAQTPGPCLKILQACLY